MDPASLLIALGMVVVCSIAIMFASNAFEDSSGYLGRNMPPGVRGASIEAIASSMPELLTTAAFLFMLSPGSAAEANTFFSAGVATCAGSAVFNAVIIPGLCVLFVLYKGVKVDGVVTKVKHITVSRAVVIRDGAFFIGAELLLIYFLGSTTLVWWMGGALIVFYLVYMGFLMGQFKRHGTTDGDDDDDDEEEEEEDEGGSSNVLVKLLKCEFNDVFFGGRAFNNKRAWVVLTAAVAVLTVACYFLAEAVILSAKALDIAPYFTAVILGAAATSVPDTVISVRDALKGDYDDAVANAVGSNIFDICVALGLPLMVYGLINGNVIIEAGSSTASDIQELRIALISVTVLILAIFLIGKTIGKGKAVMLFSIYFIWTGFVVWRAVDSDPAVDAASSHHTPAAVERLAANGGG